MSDPEITENVIDNSEEYTLKNRIDTDKVFKKRPVQGKVTTETPDVIMPVVEEVREPDTGGEEEVIEDREAMVVEEESGGANFIYEEQSRNCKTTEKSKTQNDREAVRGIKTWKREVIGDSSSKKEC